LRLTSYLLNEYDDAKIKLYLSDMVDLFVTTVTVLNSENYPLLLIIPCTLANYIEKNCKQSIQCCTRRRSKTAKIKCYKL